MSPSIHWIHVVFVVGLMIGLAEPLPLANTSTPMPAGSLEVKFIPLVANTTYLTPETLERGAFMRYRKDSGNDDQKWFVVAPGAKNIAQLADYCRGNCTIINKGVDLKLLSYPRSGAALLGPLVNEEADPYDFYWSIERAAFCGDKGVTIVSTGAFYLAVSRYQEEAISLEVMGLPGRWEATEKCWLIQAVQSSSSLAKSPNESTLLFILSIMALMIISWW